MRDYNEFSKESLDEFIDSLKMPVTNNFVAYMNYEGAIMLVQEFYKKMNKELTREELELRVNRTPCDSYGYYSSQDVYNYI